MAAAAVGGGLARPNDTWLACGLAGPCSLGGPRAQRGDGAFLSRVWQGETGDP